MAALTDTRLDRLERSIRRERILMTIALAVMVSVTISVVARQPEPTAKQSGAANEISTKKLRIVDAEGELVGLFDSGGLTIRSGEGADAWIGINQGDGQMILRGSEKSWVGITASKDGTAGLMADSGSWKANYLAKFTTLLQSGEMMHRAP